MLISIYVRIHFNTSQTAATVGKPATIAGKPLIIGGKPAMISGKPIQISGKPVQLFGKPRQLGLVQHGQTVSLVSQVCTLLRYIETYTCLCDHEYDLTHEYISVTFVLIL